MITFRRFRNPTFIAETNTFSNRTWEADAISRVNDILAFQRIFFLPVYRVEVLIASAMSRLRSKGRLWADTKDR
jgi:hypothetical protein